MHLKKILGHFFHPALWKLLRFQTAGKIRRLSGAFRSRRKLMLAIVAVVLGCVWLGQTVISILLRQPADPEQLKIWLPVSLFLYCVFHCLKIGSRKPVEPFDWTPAEKQLLLGAPIRRMHLVTYRFISYLGATTAKAACFALIMTPDLPNLMMGFSGMFMGLLLIELFRMLLEQLAWVSSQTSKKHWLVTRLCMLVPAGGLVAFAFFQTFYAEGFNEAASSKNPLNLIQFFLAKVGEISSMPVISWLMIPWHATIDVVLSTGSFVGTLVKMTSIETGVISLSALVYFIDHRGQKWLEKLPRKQFNTQAANGTSAIEKTEKRPSKNATVPTGFGGAKSIVWYQLIGAFHYRSALAFSLGIPVFLCCIPMLANNQLLNSSFNILGSIVFYSFILLPAALLLDYRRDARKLILWKSMPINPMSLTIGHVSIPVALMSLFQLVVLVLATTLGGYSPMLLLAWPLFVPMNVFIIGMENAIFLMHPIRRNQEGFEVFIRTILTFTGKGLLFAVGLVGAIGWAFTSLWIANYLPWRSVTGPALFGIGVWVALSIVAWLTLKFCTRLFQNMDVSQDLPATV